MDKNFGAYLIEQGSKLASDLVKVAVLRSSKKAPAPAEEARLPAPSAPPSALSKASQSSVGTGCAPCTSDHLSTCSGALAEALRFARTRGVEDGEVQGRLSLCIDELNIWERVDAAPDKVASVSAGEKEFLRRWLPKGRDLRHRVNEVGSLEDLEATAALARQLSLEGRAEMRQLRPPVMNKIEALSKKVKAGDISNKAALGQLTDWWGSEKSAMTTSPSNPSKTEPLPLKPEVPKEIKFFPDSSEDYRRSIDQTGLRPQLDKVFREAIARANGR